MPGPPLPYCAIDFGTSNSAIAIPAGHGSSRLVELEAGEHTMPTAVFYFAEHEPLAPGAEPPRAFGRAAIAAYVDGYEGRLMRSMKSILGSTLVEQTTDVGGGHAVKFLDVITGYLRHLRHAAEAALGAPITHAVLGRPVFFVDGDAQRDAQAQASLETAARAVGLREVVFQYEPIAAAFDYEQQATREQCVLVADIGGGTSDFSVVRVGPDRRGRTERKDDILASHGVHIAGTDFDRRIELTGILRELGYGAFGPARGDQPPREVPSAVYFDLATWHLINTVYQPARVAELKNMAAFYADPRHHRRLLRTVSERLGHELLARAEAAKIAVAEGGDTQIDLGLVERELSVPLGSPQAAAAIDSDVERIVEAARLTVKQAGLSAASVDALYFTGGSTGLRLLTDRLAAAFPGARAVRGDRLASVATGLGLHAQRWFAAAR
ncbi:MULTISPECIES: Hsp70 family protein [unclassified Methylibium]|uniref:Hsp70 family protein n=1 Tax=unclassified Methylibium TaxID=2633235 RepID=UPI0007022DA6|nr:Hsp70 family protein [Methylibium sp. Root1272]KQW76177.1 heat-shock protein [Methylibium sp. Root1272]